MTDREKLEELLYRAHHNASSVMGCGGSEEEAIEEEARYLLANGVTVQNWRDAKIDPPPIGEDVLLRFANETMVVGGLREDGGWYVIVDAEWYSDCEAVPEKWQPLPGAPQTEEEPE